MTTPPPSPSLDPTSTRRVTPNFITETIDADLECGRFERVVTRFPPEPNGFAHLGHTFASLLNYGIAQDYGGSFVLRMDDTNPEAEKLEYAEAIVEDLTWLGLEWSDKVSYASDYFAELHGFALELIRQGNAYVDSSSAEEIRRLRGTAFEVGTPSPYRQRSVSENLELFERMKNGEFPNGAHVLRAKIDLSSSNMKLRDLILYRIVHANHYRHGDAWCIYPSYDFAQALTDALGGVTHSLCSLEFVDNRAVYDWLLEKVWSAPVRPHQYEFGRRSLEYTVVSKRKLRRLVEENRVSGWDDPRMPTLAGVRRRGVTPQAVQAFARQIGVSRTNRTVEIAIFEGAVRDDLNLSAPRALAVLRPLKLTLENLENERSLELPYWPFDVIRESPDGLVALPSGERVAPEQATRAVPLTREVWIEQDDFLLEATKGFKRLTVGGKVRLRGAGIVRCDSFETDDAGKVLELRGTLLPEGEKAGAVIHWLSAAHAVPAEFRIYDRLFRVPNPEASARDPNGAEAKELEDDDGEMLEEKDFLDFLNPNSLEVLRGFVEPSVLSDPKDTRYQFERLGYFWRDPVDSQGDSRPDALVFNRIMGLKDTWDSHNKESTSVGAHSDAPSSAKPELKLQNEHSSPLALELTLEQNATLERLTQQGIGEQEARVLAREPQLLDYLEQAAEFGDKATQARWVVNDLGTALRSSEVKLRPAQLAALVQTVHDGSLSARSAKEVLLESLESGADPLELIEQRGLRQVSDTGALEAAVNEVLRVNPDKLEAYRGGKKGLMGFFVGQVMKATGGQANPQVLAEVLGRLLEG